MGGGELTVTEAPASHFRPATLLNPLIVPCMKRALVTIIAIIALALTASASFASEPIAETEPYGRPTPSAKLVPAAKPAKSNVKAPSGKQSAEAAAKGAKPSQGPPAGVGHEPAAAFAAEAAEIKGGASKANRPFSLVDPKSWPFSFVPVPEVATDPNQGTTVGVLPVFLFNNEHHEIRSIFAPDINYNTNIGAGGTVRYLAYPSENTQWYVIGSAAQQIARRVDLFYSTGRTRHDRWSLDGRFYFERDPTDRFFGIGNQSNQNNETNFTTEQVYGDVRLSYNFSPELQLTLWEKPRYVRIQHGALDNLPFIGTLFPTVKGLGGGSDIMNRLMVSYDTRDAIDIPRHGGLARVFGGISDRRFMSSVSYTQFGGEVRRYVPLGSRITLAGHAFLQYTPAGNETPFWAMGRLGGEDSLLTNQQTLRGYGAGRYVDNNLSVANLEMRTRVYETNLFDTHGIVELAPFIEAGKVFHTPRDNPINRLHPVGGIGFRGIAEPFVVGYVDVGYGGEGTSIFSGINYPF